MICRAALIFLIGASFLLPAGAEPCLVSIELGDESEIARWRSLGFPTYAYLAKTAIAEVDDSELLSLSQQGLAVQVIDETPWVGEYLAFDTRWSHEAELPGLEIWQKGNTSVRELSVIEIGDLLGRRVEYRPLSRSPLPDRFWEQLLVKTVPIRSVQWDPWVQSLVDQVNTDSLTNYIQRLQNFVTRQALAESSYAASQWLFDRFEQMDYPCQFDSFYIEWTPPDHPYDPGYERNVIATLAGSDGLSNYYIIGGHFDSVAEPGNAPGADDNASGTACILEAARIFSGQSVEHTIEFICWAAEEFVADAGSRDYAERAVQFGWDIAGFLEFDMIGYMGDAYLDCEVRTEGAVSYPLRRLFIEAAETYVPSMICVEIDGTGGDASLFSYYGFRTVSALEYPVGENPYYHSTDDLLEHLSPELYTAITKVAVATVAVLAVSPDVVEDVTAHDVGDGESLVISWTAGEESDLVGYSIEWGTASGDFADSTFIAGGEATSGTLMGLMADSTYYIAVRAVDADGYRSWGAEEVIAMPSVTPLAPTDVVASPIAQGIRIDWAPNDELDMEGYRVYRRVDESTMYDSLNTALLNDTTYTDVSLSGEYRYYYAIKAVDQSGNASLLSEEACGRPITLDQGILVIDETKNSHSFPDSLQDAFYRYILDSYRYEEHDYASSGQRPSLTDMGPYSTVVWHADDYTQRLASDCIDDLKSYLDHGGHLWFMGWKPAYNLGGDIVYPVEFAPGGFFHEYLKVADANLSVYADPVEGAVGQIGYGPLYVDPEKVPTPSWEATMRYFEALTVLPSAEEIFITDMADDESPFEGAVCGIRYLGSDFQIVYLGFPLYFMDQDQARVVAQKVMSDFGELPVDEDAPGGLRVTALRLLQNTPNPFPDRTSIKYHIPESGAVSLKVYNIAGRLVRTLVSDQVGEGIHNVVWEGTDIEGQSVGNGVYFYRLRFRDRTLSRKLVLIR